ncbi:Xylulose-5-phosphate phosphoketolase @ Fructose-6-phosphate phosphoketolase, partial [hydrothermal vent metagenome]
DDDKFDMLFTTSTPVIFAFHGYPSLIHRLVYKRTCHHFLHVHGYKEEGTTTTPFDMAVRNELDRFHLVLNVVKQVPAVGSRAGEIRQAMNDKLAEHHKYITTHGQDMPEIINWKWPLS